MEGSYRDCILRASNNQVIGVNSNERQVVKHEHTKSFPNSETERKKSQILKLHRQFSHDMAMQNNCTVLSNKVGPVVIKNCKEEFQMRQVTNKALGKLHETSTEHELLLDKYFLLKDQFVGIDRHDTLEKHGVPNMRKRFDRPTVYAIGQPTLNGLKKFTSALLQNHKLVYYVNVRSVPTLFLRRSDDFLPYSGYCCVQNGDQKIELSERELHDTEREMQCQALSIASTNADETFYYYNVLDPSPDEPHMYKTSCMEDLVTSRQIFAKILTEHKNIKYQRLPLSTMSKPSPAWIDSLMEILKDANVFQNEDVALVFQGLTGEASACLAVILTALTVSPTITKKTKKKQVQVRSLQELCLWRETIILNIMEASKLDQASRNEVDAAISSVIHESLLVEVAKEARQKNEMDRSLLQRELAITFNEQNGEDPYHQKIEKQISFNPNTSGSLSLRDVSELSLPAHHHKKESSYDAAVERKHDANAPDYVNDSLLHFEFCSRVNTVVRYEANDEECLIRSLLTSSDLYLLILIYRKYINEQRLHVLFSKWLNHHPKFIFDIAQMWQYNSSVDYTLPLELTAKSDDTNDCLPGSSYHRVVGFPCFGMEQSLPETFANVVKRLCHSSLKVSYNGVVFINCREEMTFYTSSDQSNHSSKETSSDAHHQLTTQWELKAQSIPFLHGASSAILEDAERKLTSFMNKKPENVSLINVKDLGAASGSFKTVKAALEDIGNDDSLKDVCDNFRYIRLPLPRHRIPKFEIFDRVIEIVRDTHEKDAKTAFIFFCHNGKRRSVNMMAVACLVLGHMKGFSENIGSILGDRFEPWVPDAEYTRGEFRAVIELMQILPDCNSRKKEVDYILDIIHESMSTVHYHPRENLNPGFKKVNRAKCFEEFLRLKQHSLQNLEFYTVLILFNCYLYQEKYDFWRSLSFDDWIDTHATQIGVLDILDNLGFQSLGEDEPLNRMLQRWQATTSLIRDIVSVDDVTSFSSRQRVLSGSLGGDMSSTPSLRACLEAESI